MKLQRFIFLLDETATLTYDFRYKVLQFYLVRAITLEIGTLKVNTLESIVYTKEAEIPDGYTLAQYLDECYSH